MEACEELMIEYPDDSANAAVYNFMKALDFVTPPNWKETYRRSF